MKLYIHETFQIEGEGLEGRVFRIGKMGLEVYDEGEWNKVTFIEIEPIESEGE